MRVLHLDYGILEYSEFSGLYSEMRNLINGCDNFIHFDYNHFTKDGKHGVKVKMELMENNRPQGNDLPAEPAKSIITFSVFRDITNPEGLRQISYSVLNLHDIKPFYDEVITLYTDE